MKMTLVGHWFLTVFLCALSVLCGFKGNETVGDSHLLGRRTSCPITTMM